MQKYDYKEPKVKEQRLSDEEKIRLELKLSKRHREWGWNVPMVDIDFLVVEYDKAIPVAIIEYKHERAEIQKSGHPSYKAIKLICERAELPFFAVRYADDFEWFSVIAINKRAQKIVKNTIQYSEEKYFEFLYKIRGRHLEV